jgi:CTP synthase
MKTKPTQHASRQLNSVGINADILVARGSMELDRPRREKLATFCGVPKDHCISAPDVPSIYEIPLKMEKQDMGNKLLRVLGLKERESDLTHWKRFVSRISNAKKEVKIAVVGKYFGTGDFTLADSYHSVIEAVKHAAWHHNAKPTLTWVDSEKFEQRASSVKQLEKYDAILVPGGFGTRGVEGIIKAVTYAREQKIPYLGLCYGMQLACIEFVRNVLDIPEATTVEMDDAATHPVIHINPGQAKNVKEKRYGGTMRLGAYKCTLKKGSKTFKAYGTEKISERHRHRYEFNNTYRDDIDKAGLKVVGVNPESDLVEIVELDDHPFFIGTQFHPEFKSRPMNPHPLFRSFVGAGLRKKK